MKHLLVRHKVADFPKWKHLFDSHAKAQEDAGLIIKRIFRNTDDAKEIFLLFEVHDLERARAYFAKGEILK